MAKKKKGSSKVAVIMISLSFVIIMATVFLADTTGVALVPTAGGPRQRDDLIDIPRVATTIRDPDGNFHNVEADVSLLFDEDAVDSQSIEALHMQVADLMARLDYTYLAQLHDTGFVSEYLREGLWELVPQQELLEVFVTEMQSGENRIPMPGDNQNHQGRTFMESLFPGLGN